MPLFLRWMSLKESAGSIAYAFGKRRLSTTLQKNVPSLTLFLLRLDKGEPISGERFDHGHGVGPCALTVLLPVRVFNQGELELLDFSSSSDIATVQQ